MKYEATLRCIIYINYSRLDAFSNEAEVVRVDQMAVMTNDPKFGVNAATFR